MYIGQWRLSPLQSRLLRTSEFSQSPSAAPLYFPESHHRSETSLSKVILVLGKARNLGAPNLCCRRAESTEWFDVLPKNSAWDVMHEQAHCHDEAANHQLPIAMAFWIIQIISTDECSSLMHNFIESLLYWVILNVTATQYTCSLNSIYYSHWLVQWSCHCSHMCINVHQLFSLY